MSADILVVDDNVGIRQLLLEFFKEEGYFVEVAENGMEAINKLLKLTPSVVVLDIKMPGMDGLQVIKEMDRLSLKVPVIIITAYGETNKLNELKHSSLVKNYISKPFNLNELSSIVNSVIINNESFENVIYM